MTLFSRREMVAMAGGAALSGGVFTSTGQARAIQPGLLEITGNDAVTVAKVLSLLTVVPVGSGRMLTSYMSSYCGVCQQFAREYPAFAVPGIAMRYVPYALVDAESGAVDRVLVRPDLATFRSFMARQFSSVAAVPFDDDVSITDAPATATQRYSRHVKLLTAITFLFRRNGTPDLPEGTPRFVFTSQTGAAYMVVGTPTRAMFADIARLK